jgi:hypothetical protein
MKRPVKYEWLLIDYEYCTYMQWLLDLEQHFTNVWTVHED